MYGLLPGQVIAFSFFYGSKLLDGKEKMYGFLTKLFVCVCEDLTSKTGMFEKHFEYFEDTHAIDINFFVCWRRKRGGIFISFLCGNGVFFFFHSCYPYLELETA